MNSNTSSFRKPFRLTCRPAESLRNEAYFLLGAAVKAQSQEPENIAIRVREHNGISLGFIGPSDWALSFFRESVESRVCPTGSGTSS